VFESTARTIAIPKDRRRA